MKPDRMVTVSRLEVAGTGFAVAIPADALIKTAKRAAISAGWHEVVCTIAVREEAPSAIIPARRASKCSTKS
ncbi:MAG: hypothetical protein ACOY4R_27605 [Pseudomonadota bacterium]